MSNTIEAHISFILNVERLRCQWLQLLFNTEQILTFDFSMI